jgi:hypothetical protein
MADSKHQTMPLPTNDVSFPRHLDGLCEQLAEHVHNLWASKRRAEKWTWGPARSDEKREHPDLVSFENLPESEKEYDRAIVRAVIGAIIALGYCVVPPNHIDHDKYDP